MKNLNNLGLVEMTEQEMRGTIGGNPWVILTIGLTLVAVLYSQETSRNDTITNTIPNYRRGKCYCDTLSGNTMCPSCSVD